MTRWLLAAALAAGLGSAALAQPAEDPDWPCIQRKVPHLSPGQMWAGPPLPEDRRAWRDDPELGALAARIAARRTAMEEVPALLDGVQAGGGQSRDARLVALFAGIFELIDAERARIIEGIERYARKQRALTERIEARQAEIAAAREEAGAEDHAALDRIEELEDALAWDIRVYKDRRESLTYVCESPVILERRAFALARLIQERLSGE
ncbi:MAG TPA: hypothetical protein VFR34_08095 [Paracoccaceae bacterium]|nr:hypothetical protein [Paracoccaceae bacterium]